MPQPPSFDVSRRWLARVILCAAALVGAAWALAGRLNSMLGSPHVLRVDEQTAAWIHAHAGPVAMCAFNILTSLHGTASILVLVALCGACLWRTRWRAIWPLLVASVPGGMLVNAALKQAVQRSRPEWGYAYQTIASYSFPSGHTAAAALLYGFVLLLLWPLLRSSVARSALLVVSVSMVLLVACSRIALGVHYLSDCIAAACEAAIWLAVCLTGVRRSPIAARPVSARPTTSPADGGEDFR